MDSLSIIFKERGSWRLNDMVKKQDIFDQNMFYVVSETKKKLRVNVSEKFKNACLTTDL